MITANRDLAPEIMAMIKRTIKRIVEGASHSSKEERIEAILNFAKYNLVPEDTISESDIEGRNQTRKSSTTCMDGQKKSMPVK